MILFIGPLLSGSQEVWRESSDSAAKLVVPTLKNLEPLEQESVGHGPWAKPNAKNGFCIFTGSVSTCIVSSVLPLGLQSLKHLLSDLSLKANKQTDKKLCQPTALEDYVANSFQSKVLPRSLHSVWILIVCYLCDHHFLSWLMMIMPLYATM